MAHECLAVKYGTSLHEDQAATQEVPVLDVLQGRLDQRTLADAWQSDKREKMVVIGHNLGHQVVHVLLPSHKVRDAWQRRLERHVNSFFEFEHPKRERSEIVALMLILLIFLDLHYLFWLNQKLKDFCLPCIVVQPD